MRLTWTSALIGLFLTAPMPFAGLRAEAQPLTPPPLSGAGERRAPVGGPPLPGPSSGSQGVFGTEWAKPYPQTGSQIRSDGYRDRRPYQSGQQPNCPVGTRRLQSGACVR